MHGIYTCIYTCMVYIYTLEPYTYNIYILYHTKLHETLPLTGWYVDVGHNLCQS